jgi:hypothetical protein
MCVPVLIFFFPISLVMIWIQAQGEFHGTLM